MEFTFKLNGVKYTDIKGYRSVPDRIYIGVAGTAQMIRQFLKNEYPSLPSRNYFWVQSETFANGDSIRVYLNEAPDEIYQNVKNKLSVFKEGSFDPYTDTYNYSDVQEKTEDGKSISYGTKYLFVENRQPYGANAPTVDWTIKSKPRTFQVPSRPSVPSTTSPSEKKSYPMGEVLKDCSGWIIYKKTLPDARIVYNVKIKPDTDPNKTDWNAIKGEIWTETGFKWGKFGAFEKWGQISSEDFVVNLLCKILGKYYKSDSSSEVPESTPTPPQPEAKPQEQTPIPQPLPAPQQSKEDIQKAIKGLQYLADKGDENAKKAIKGLQYLLNK